MRGSVPRRRDPRSRVRFRARAGPRPLMGSRGQTPAAIGWDAAREDWTGAGGRRRSSPASRSSLRETRHAVAERSHRPLPASLARPLSLSDWLADRFSTYVGHPPARPTQTPSPSPSVAKSRPGTATRACRASAAETRPSASRQRTRADGPRQAPTPPRYGPRSLRETVVRDVDDRLETRAPRDLVLSTVLK